MRPRRLTAIWTAITLCLSLATAVSGSSASEPLSAFRAAGTLHGVPPSSVRFGAGLSSHIRPPARHTPSSDALASAAVALVATRLVASAAGRTGLAPSVARPRRLAFRYDATAPPAAQ